jgi:hypothetical protein
VKLDKINAVTVFLKLEVDKDTKKLNVTLEKVSMKPEFQSMSMEVIRG